MRKFLLLGCLVVFLTHVLYAQTTNPKVTITAATNATVDNSFVVSYSGDDANDWETKISNISIGGVNLTSTAYSVNDGSNEITFTPANSESLQKAIVNLQFTIIATGYNNVIFTQTIKHGTATQMELTTQPVGPNANGESLATQPALQLKDKYNNNCTENSTLVVTAAVASAGDAWIAGGTTTATASGGVVTFSGLTAYADVKTSNAKIAFSATGTTTITSNAFSIGMTSAPSVSAENSATIDDNVVLTYSNNDAWRDKISAIKLNGTTLAVANYTTSTSGEISLHTADINTLHSPGDYTITIKANGYQDVTVNQTLAHGNPTKITVAQQPEAPLTNGGELTVQPAIKLFDKYDNPCNKRNFSVTAAAKTTDWTIGGTVNVTSNDGNVVYSGLTATSTAGTQNAVITFTYNTVTAESNPFSVGLTAPALTVTANATVDKDFDLSFTDNFNWRNNISKITANGTEINSDYYTTTAAGKITFNVAQITAMHTPGNFNIEITSKGFKVATVTQTLTHGEATQLVITQQPAAPATNGGVLATQPNLELRDKYNNVCTTNTATVTATAKDNAWTIGGTTSLNATAGVVNYTDITASVTQNVNNAQIVFKASGLEVTSNAFNLAINNAPVLTADNTANTVDNTITITFTNNADWRSKISKVTINDTEIIASNYVLGVGQIEFNPASIIALQKTGNATVKIEATGYTATSVTQTMKHGTIDKLVVATQPTSPATNGGAFAQQPVVQLQDKYNNICTSNSDNVTASEDNSSNWTLGGTKQIAATSGVATYTDLTAAVTAPTTAKIVFATATKTVESNSFNLGLTTPPTLTAATNATVDNSFDISYSGDSDWNGNITSVTVDGVNVTYSKSIGRITLDPASNNVLQTAKENAQIVVKATGYNDASVLQTIKHGAATGLAVLIQPTAPINNGDALQQQPVVGVKDKYGNVCKSVNTNKINAEAVGADWTLSGTAEVNIQNGKATYTNLAATANKSVTAQIKFTYNSFEVISNGFNLALTTTPTLSAGSGEKSVDNTFDITYSGANADNWEAKIDDIFVGTERLSIGAYTLDKTNNRITFDPSKSELLQKVGTLNIIVKAQTYADASVNVTLTHGAFAKIAITQEPEAPETNGAVLKTQPKIAYQDQYGNTCTTNLGSSNVTATANNANWTLGGTTTISPSNGIAEFTNLTATTTTDLIDAKIVFTVGDKTVTSKALEFNLDAAPTLNAASGATVDGNFEITYTETTTTNTWESAANKAITLNGVTVPTAAFEFVSSNNKIIFKPAASALFQKPVTNGVIVIKVNNFKSATVNQTIAHGVAKNISITTQPVAATSNGGALAQQPVLQLTDKYNNNCTNDSATQITAAENDDTKWTLGGTKQVVAVNGVVTFTNLTTTSIQAVTSIHIVFSGTGLTPVNSAAFNIVANAGPALTAATNATVDAPFKVTFTDSGNWQSGISKITYNGQELPNEAYNTTVANEITFDPSKSEILQKAGTANLSITSNAFDNNSIEQTIKHGAAKSMYVTLQPTAPAENGAVLATQPKVGLKDQYGNNCTTDNTTDITVAKGDTGNWTLGGTLTVPAVKGIATFTNLTATSEDVVSGAYLVFSSGSFTTVNSSAFNIPLTAAPELHAATDATVDSPFQVNYGTGADDPQPNAWENATAADKVITFNGETIPAEAYTFNTSANSITFDPSKSEVLQKARTAELVVKVKHFASTKISQTIAHGAANAIVIAKQPIAPIYNGGELNVQPEVYVKDKYNNKCTSDNTTEITATANSSEWTLGGTVTAKVTNGTLTYTNLTAASDKAIQGVFIEFKANGVTSASSAKFNLGTNISPKLTAATNATVDAPFEISFTNKDDWQNNITIITYNDVVLDASAYSTTTANKIIFYPAKSVTLQKPNKAEIVVTAKAFNDARIEQIINNGVAKTMYVKTEPTAPTSNGGVLDTQPQIGLRDQYNNECITDNSTQITVERGDNNDWTLGGTLTVAANKGVVSFTGLTASSTIEVPQAFLKFTATNFITVISEKFAIPLNSKPKLFAAKDATVDAPFAITFTDNANWRNSIKTIKFGDTVLDSKAYTTTERGEITFNPAESKLLQKPSTTVITILADGYAAATVEQTIAHGAIAKMDIQIQPVGPDLNGHALATQPIVRLRDKYNNICDSDSKTIVTAVASGGTWTIHGNTKVAVVNGIATFTNIIARSTKKVTDATVTFSCSGAADLVSDPFIVPAPADGVALAAEANATVDNPFTITFTENSIWRTAVDSIFCNGSKLATAAFDKTQAGKLIIDPAKDEKLQQVGDKALKVYATGYNFVTVTQKLNHGVPNKMKIAIQPIAPKRNGTVLAVQPALHVLDKYGNKCSTENNISITVAKGDAQEWTLGGTLTKKAVDGSVNFADLTASSQTAITGAFITFSSEGLPNANSNTFDIPKLETAPKLTASTDARVDKVFSITFTENKIWRTEISEIRFGKDILPKTAYDITAEGKITFDPSKTDILHTAAIKYMVVSSKSFPKDSVQQDLRHGTATTITITQQPKKPNQNGNLLTQQPIVKLFDKYNNACNREITVTIKASATGGSWYLEGESSITVTNGVAAFTDLTAGSGSAIDNATITFSGTGLTTVESEPFQIPAPQAAPNLLAATNATVDNPFTITFAEYPKWQSGILSISFNGKKLPANAYDFSEQGKITFTPANSPILQVATAADILVASKGFSDVTVSQVINHGKVAKLKITKQPKAPEYSAGELVQQPDVQVVDQYGNICKSNSDFKITVAKGDAGKWTLGGTTTLTVTHGLAEFSKLTASSDESVTGAFLTFTGADVPAVNSATFDIPAFKVAPQLTAQANATVDNDIIITFDDKTNQWTKHIAKLLYGGKEIKSAHYTVNANNIVLQVVKEPLLQKSGTFKVEVLATGYKSATVEQAVKHGAVDKMILNKQPLSPLTNGALLRQQPELTFVDQYENICVSETTKTITVKKYDEGIWTLAGTKEIKANNGVITYTDLSAYSTAPIIGATLAFTSKGLYTVVSNSFDIPDIGTPPELTAAENATVDNPFAITFSENEFWRNKITAIKVGDKTLAADSYDKTLPGKIRFTPSASKVLQKSGELKIVIEATGFDNNHINQQLHNGVVDSLIFVKQPTAPTVNGELLATQPELKLVDQYLNICETNSVEEVVVSKADEGAWTLAGTLKVAANKGIVAYTDLTASSDLAVTGAKLKFTYSKGDIESEVFNLPVPVIALTAAKDATVDKTFVVTFTDNKGWRKAITAISFAGETLKAEAYTIEEGKITLDPAKDVNLQKAQTAKIVVTSTGFANSEVEQVLKHGAPASMVVVKQPVGPKKNGGKLVGQPILNIVDKYKNICVENNSIEVTAEKYIDDAATKWTLGGTLTLVATKGVITYKDLTAASENLIEKAKIQFTSYEFDPVVSSEFEIIRPDAPKLIAAKDATVDEPFAITFAENKAWREAITDIKYGIISIKGNFDASVPGKITIDPAKATIFQKAGVNTITVISGKFNQTECKQAITHGKAKNIIIKKQPTQPLKNGGALVKQPQLLLQDQYRNNCNTDNETPITVIKGDDGDWTLSGTTTVVAKDGIVIYSNLKATSSVAISNAYLEFTGDNVNPTQSGTFNIPEPKGDRAGTAYANPERVCAGSSSNITLKEFDGNIQWQIYNNDTGKYENIDGETASVHVTKAIEKNERYRAKVTKDGFTPQYSNVVTVSPINPVKADFSFEVKFNNVQFTNLSENATSLQWEFGDGQISSEVNPSHSYILKDMNGTGFQVTLTASNGACADSKKTKEVFIVTGIEDLVAEKGVVVYPNPSDGAFFMEVRESKDDGMMRIFDTNGKVVYTKSIEKHFGAKKMHFNLQSLAKGIYVITVQYPTKVIKTKLLIK